jgi:hypothetical protein
MNLHCALIAHSSCESYLNETKSLIPPTKLRF